MDLTAFRAGMRAAMTGTVSAAKGKTVLSRPSSPSRFQPTPTQLRTLLEGIHQRIRTAQAAAPMYDAVDEYVATAAQLALALQSGGMARGADSVLSAGAIAAPFIPGGAVLSAAISSVGNLKSTTSGA
jgi:hypothetical protein